MKRRQGLALIAAGGLAAAAGAGWAWWRSRPDNSVPPALWQLALAKPDSGQLALAAFRGRPLVINFWATWCAPCIKELPQIDRFHRDFSGRGWQVVGIAIDGAEPVREFLKARPVGYPVGLAGLEGSDVMAALGNPQGALPFTVVLGADGSARHARLGETSYDELAGWAKGG